MFIFPLFFMLCALSSNIYSSRETDNFLKKTSADIKQKAGTFIKKAKKTTNDLFDTNYKATKESSIPEINPKNFKWEIYLDSENVKRGALSDDIDNKSFVTLTCQPMEENVTYWTLIDVPIVISLESELQLIPFLGYRFISPIRISESAMQYNINATLSMVKLPKEFKCSPSEFAASGLLYINGRFLPLKTSAHTLSISNRSSEIGRALLTFKGPAIELTNDLPAALGSSILFTSLIAEKEVEVSIDKDALSVLREEEDLFCKMSISVPSAFKSVGFSAAKPQMNKETIEILKKYGISHNISNPIIQKNGVVNVIVGFHREKYIYVDPQIFEEIKISMTMKFSKNTGLNIYYAI